MPTLRAAAADADCESLRLLTRAGMVRKLGPGCYQWLPLGARVLGKLEGLARASMDSLGGQEVRLPLVEHRRRLEKSGRWDLFRDGFLTLEDGSVLPSSSEESALEAVLRDVRSYKQLPLLLYQSGPKLEREPKPRLGPIRAREYLSLDAYSVHADEDSAAATAAAVLDGWSGLLGELGLASRVVEADPAGYGLESRELIVFPAAGSGPSAAEDEVALCDACSYRATLERAECGSSAPAAEPGCAPPPGLPPLEEVKTPGKTSVAEVSEFLGVPPESLLKTQLYMADGAPVMALVRGDHALCEAKLQAVLGPVRLTRATPEQYERVTGCAVGFAGPVNLPRWKTPDGKMEAVRIFADLSTRGMGPAVSGANKADTHAKNIHMGRDFVPDRYADLRLAAAGDPCPKCVEGRLKLSRGISVARAFRLGTRLSEAFGAEYTDPAQGRRPMSVCRYGLGLSRLLSVAAEVRRDEDGLLWPPAIAPFSVGVMPLSLDDPSVVEYAVAVYQELRAMGIDALLEDRPDRPGVRFKDLDLIGIPLRLVVSKKGLEAGRVELKYRERSERELIDLGDGPNSVAIGLADRVRALL